MGAKLSCLKAVKSLIKLLMEWQHTKLQRAHGGQRAKVLGFRIFMPFYRTPVPYFENRHKLYA